MHDLKPGEDEGKVSWYPEPFFVLNETRHKKVTGTFRSSICLRAADAGTFPDDMCSACSDIPKLKSFRKRILLRTEKIGEDTSDRDTTRVRNEYLTSKEMVQKLKEQKEKLDQKDDKLFFITSAAVRLRIRAGSLRDKLREYSRRGSIKAVCYKLQKAADLGLLDDKTTLKAMLETVSRNLHVQKNGKRYQPSFKFFPLSFLPSDVGRTQDRYLCGN